MKRIILCLVAMVCVLLAARGSLLFNALSGLKNKTHNQPVVVVRPGGGYVALWEEKEVINEYPYYNGTRYFYQVFDAAGNLIVPIRELDFWKNYYTPYEYTENSLMLLDSDHLLIVARKMTKALSNPPGYRLEKLIIDLTHGTVSRDSNKVSFQNCFLVRDSEGNVYAIELGFSRLHYLEIVQVEPSFGKLKELIERYPRKNYMKHYLSSEDNVVTMTSQNNLLVVGRVKSVAGKPVDESPDAWRGLPNRLACFLVDTTGNAKIESYEIDLTEVAFRRIPGIHLGIGGYYPYKGSIDGLDFTHLLNGDIILSVTGLDKKGEFCMYQVRFNSAGKLQKSSTLKEVKPRPFPKDHSLPVFKVKPVVTSFEQINSRNKIRREYLLFGFDEEGNFYEEREIWKEGEK